MNVDLEHPEYRAKAEMWGRYRDLYVGGEQMRRNASRHLLRRHKEPLDVYRERMGLAYYENYLGSIVDWYAATLFRREPVLTFETEDAAARRFLAGFTEDCDGRGTSLTDYFRTRFIETMVTGVSYTLVDLPRPAGRRSSRGEEEASGAARAYLVPFAAEELVNWSEDEKGELEWVVLRTSHLRKRDVTDPRWERETQWRYYDRERFQTWLRAGEGQEIELVDEGPHALTGRRVPLFETRVQEGLWLVNKAGSLQLEHFNKANALSWALTMGLFAMPVVYSRKPFEQMVGESYFVQLEPDDRFGWTEPEGKVYQLAADNLSRLQEEIYRVCFLLSQVGSPRVTQSAMSKQRDFAVTQEVLRAYGDSVKDAMKRTLGGVAAARGEDVRVGVSGVDEFDIGDFRTQLEDAERLLQLGIDSPTLQQQVMKKLAHHYLCDERQETKERIAQEIEASVQKGAK